MSARGRLVVVAVLAVCLLALAALVLWPHHPDVNGVYRLIDRLLGPLVHDGLPAVLLRTGALEFAGNVAMFVPLGFLGTLVLPKRLWWAAPLACLVLSCGIETFQLLFLPGRTFAVRDIVGNTLGGVIGSGLALAVRGVVHAVSGRRSAPAE